MPLRGFFRLVSGLTALVIIAIAIGSKIPTSQCHCHDEGAAKQQECPFKKLRTVVASFAAAAPLTLQLEPISLEQADSAEVAGPLEIFNLVHPARAPPAAGRIG